MSQHVTEHSFGGTDSLLAKWNALVGKGAKEKICSMVSSLFLQMQVKFLPPLVDGYQAKECCALDPVKADICSCRGKTLKIHNHA